MNIMPTPPFTSIASSGLSLVPLSPSDYVEAPFKRNGIAISTRELRSFIDNLKAMLDSFSPSSKKIDMATIIIIECLQFGYVTEGAIKFVASRTKIKASLVISTLIGGESSQVEDNLWVCDDHGRYSLTD